MSIIERALEKKGDTVPGQLPNREAHRERRDVEERNDGKDHYAYARSLRIVGEDIDGDQLGREYRRLKRPLVDNITGGRAVRVDGGDVIVITSSIPGEGKTFTAMNLSISMALERDLEVIVIDGDLAKRDLSRTFGIAKEPGLTDLVDNESIKWEEVAQRTTVPHLNVIGAGHEHSRATELLASARMRRIVEQMRDPSGRRAIIIDSPPLLVTTEAQALTAVAGQVICVVQANRTSRRAVREAIEMIDERKAVSLILNQRKRALGENESYGYYGYYA